MSLSHDGFTFFSNPSGPIVTAGPHEPQIIVSRFFGLIGESHLLGETWGRDLFCEYRFQGYNTTALLMTDWDTLGQKIVKLTGTLAQTISGNTANFPSCTFLGFVPSRPMFLDGSGVNGWVQPGRLIWRQRVRS